MICAGIWRKGELWTLSSFPEVVFDSNDKTNVWSFSPFSNSWTPRPTLPYHFHHSFKTVFAVDDTLVFFGGIASQWVNKATTPTLSFELKHAIYVLDTSTLGEADENINQEVWSEIADESNMTSGIMQCTSYVYQYTNEYFCMAGTQGVFKEVDDKIHFFAFNPLTLVFRQLAPPPVMPHTNHKTVIIDRKKYRIIGIRQMSTLLTMRAFTLPNPLRGLF